MVVLYLVNWQEHNKTWQEIGNHKIGQTAKLFEGKTKRNHTIIYQIVSPKHSDSDSLVKFDPLVKD